MKPVYSAILVGNYPGQKQEVMTLHNHVVSAKISKDLLFAGLCYQGRWIRWLSVLYAVNKSYPVIKPATPILRPRGLGRLIFRECAPSLTAAPAGSMSAPGACGPGKSRGRFNQIKKDPRCKGSFFISITIGFGSPLAPSASTAGKWCPRPRGPRCLPGILSARTGCPGSGKRSSPA